MNYSEIEKIEDVLPNDHPVEANEMLEQKECVLPSEHIVEPDKTMEQREYDLYMSLIHKYIDQIMDGNETLIRNCRGMAKRVMDEFKK